MTKCSCTNSMLGDRMHTGSLLIPCSISLTIDTMMFGEPQMLHMIQILHLGTGPLMLQVGVIEPDA